MFYSIFWKISYKFDKVENEFVYYFQNRIYNLQKFVNAGLRYPNFDPNVDVQVANQL